MLARVLRADAKSSPAQVMHWINRAMFLSPTYPDTRADAGRALWSAEQYDQATLEFSAAQKRNPLWPVRNMFLELVQRGMTVEQLWTVFEAQGPRWVCTTLQDNGRVGMAEACLRQLVEQNPQDTFALSALAERALQRGELVLAEERAQAVLAQDPANGDAALTLSRVLLAQGRVAESDEALDRARHARPDPVEVERARFQRALGAGDVERARSALVALSEAISRRGTKLTEVMLLEAQLEERRGNPTAAILHYRNAARSDPHNPQAALEATRLSLAAADEEGAVSFLREVSILHPHAAYLDQLNGLAGRGRRIPRSSSPSQ
jgi:Tfp pilus assembly protein PilF